MMPEGQRGPLKGKRKEPEEGWSAGQQETPNDGRRAGRSETEGKLSRRDGRWDMDWRGRESKEYANWGAGMTEGQEKASISMPMMQRDAGGRGADDGQEGDAGSTNDEGRR